MKERKFKFELGQFVKIATQDTAVGVKMVVVARGFIECENGIDEEYVVTFYDYGNIHKHRLNAEELIRTD